jgi:hypothetical protein
MADRMLMVTWGTPARGLESRALEVFNEALGILGRAQQEGRIESFDVALLQPNAGMNGYIAIRGTADQIAAFRERDDFRRNTVDATMCVDEIRHVEGVCNQGVADQMAMYQEAIAQLAQHA